MVLQARGIPDNLALPLFALLTDPLPPLFSHCGVTVMSLKRRSGGTVDGLPAPSRRCYLFHPYFPVTLFFFFPPLRSTPSPTATARDDVAWRAHGDKRSG